MIKHYSGNKRSKSRSGEDTDEFYGNGTISLPCLIDEEEKIMEPICISLRHIIAIYPWNVSKKIKARVDKEFWYKVETSIGAFTVASEFDWDEFQSRVFDDEDDYDTEEDEETSESSKSFNAELVSE